MADDRKRSLSFSSQNVTVQRWFGGEILDHSPGSVRMDFLKSGNAPLLMHHDMRQQIGVLSGANLKNGVGYATARFGRSAAAEDALQNVDDEIYRNTSVGYRVHEMVLDSTKNGEDTYRITDWEPYEVSLVGVPADSTVGVGREHPPDTPQTNNPSPSEARATRASSFMAPEGQETRAMADQTQAAAGTSAGAQNPAAATAADATRSAEPVIQVAPGPNAMQIEEARVRSITNMCKACNMDDGLKARWISSGESYESVSEQIMRIQEQRGKQNHAKNVATLDLSANQVREFSVIRAINAVVNKDWSKAGFEAECSQEISKRLNTIPDAMKFYIPYDVQQRSIDGKAIASMQARRGGPGLTRADVVGTASAGGYLVQTTNLGFIELLRNRSVAYRLGAKQLSGLVGNVNVPKQTAAASAFWLSSETTQITENEQTFGQMALAPHTVGAYTEISRLLLLQSSPDVEGIVNADLAAVAALAIDKGALSGSGSSGQPTGITNVSGVGAISGANITALTFAGLLQYQTALATANVMPVSAAYATTPTIAAFLMAKTRFANTNTPLWDGNLWDANGTTGVANFPGMSSNQIASQTVIFGDWNSLVVAEWGVLEIEVNPYANFQAGIIGIRAMMTIDIGLRYPAAFAVSSTTTS